VTAVCPLCAASALSPGDVSRRLLEEHWPEDGLPRYLALKRDLEAELGVDLTVTTLKQHVDEHVRYSLAVGGGSA